jgi:uncharacterized protein YjiS (DUF1127 family)
MKLFRKLIRSFQMSDTERELRALTDRELADIGLVRDDISRIARG